MMISEEDRVAGARTSVLLTIAGFDPSSGAGITADLAVFSAHRQFGISCITALTVQSTLGVEAVHAVDAAILEASLQCVDADLSAVGVKIGMLGNEANVLAVARFLEWRHEHGKVGPVVLDPVLRATQGEDLVSAKGLKAILDHLLPLVDWVTPNVRELAVLTGSKLEAFDVEAAGRSLADGYPVLNVVVTGGDGPAADDLVLPRGGEAVWLRAEKIISRATHGTGCAFSSALLCRLAEGRGALEAVGLAKQYVSEAIRRAQPRGHGIGPLHLLWPFDSL